MQYEHARTLITSLTHVDGAAAGAINACVKDLVDLCRGDLENDDVPPERQIYHRYAECRYHGQGFELRADIGEGEVTADNVRDIIASFPRPAPGSTTATPSTTARSN